MLLPGSAKSVWKHTERCATGIGEPGRYSHPFSEIAIRVQAAPGRRFRGSEHPALLSQMASQKATAKCLGLWKYGTRMYLWV
jgi:hypothetical protein